MRYIQKAELMGRLEAPHAETIRTVINGAYALAEDAQEERSDLRSALDPNLAAKLKEAVTDRYVPRLAEIARPLAALRARVEDERKARTPGQSLSPGTHALGNNVALADAALWAVRRELAPMAGMSVTALEVMSVLS